MNYYFSPKFTAFYTDEFHIKDQLPDDVVDVSESDYTTGFAAQISGKLITYKNGKFTYKDKPPVVLTDEQKIAKYTRDLSTQIDAIAKEWQYDNIYTAATYLSSSVEQFANESRLLVDWRDEAWDNAQKLLQEVTAGTKEIPVTAEDFLALVLPEKPVRP